MAVQGIRDLLATNKFRYTNTYVGGGLTHAFSAGTPTSDAADFGNEGIDPNLQSPDIYQYNLSLERELPGDLGMRVSYIGATMRGLLVDRDFNTMPASTVPFDSSNPADLARLPFAPYGFYMDNVVNRGSGQLHAFQVELRRRWKDGFAVNVAYTYAHFEQQRPGLRQQHDRRRHVRPLRHLEGPGPRPERGEAPRRVNGTWDIPVGHGRSHGSSMPGWADALFGGWTVSTLFQAKSGNNLTPFFTSFYTTSPWNTGKPLDGLGSNFCCAWRPDQVSNPNVGGSREAFFNQQAYALPRARPCSETPARAACSGPAPGS